MLHQPQRTLRYSDRDLGLINGRIIISTTPDRLTSGDTDALYAPDYTTQETLA